MNEDTDGTNGMFDRSRVILCVFMMALLVVNPFNILLSDMSARRSQDDYSRRHSTERLLHGLDSENLIE